MPITCSICQKVCVNQSGLNIHVSRKHRQDGITDHRGKADNGTTVHGYCSGITDKHVTKLNEETDTHRQRPSTTHRQKPSVIEENDDKHRQGPSTIEKNDDKHRQGPFIINDNHRRGPSTIVENDDKHRLKPSTKERIDESMDKSYLLPKPRCREEENKKFSTTENTIPVTCRICQREFKNELGLRVHFSKKHKREGHIGHNRQKEQGPTGHFSGTTAKQMNKSKEEIDDTHRQRTSMSGSNDVNYRQEKKEKNYLRDEHRRRSSMVEENDDKHRRRTSSVKENDDKHRHRPSMLGMNDESSENSDRKSISSSTDEDDRRFPTVKHKHDACCSNNGDAEGGSTKSRLLKNHISITSPSNSSLPCHVTNVTKYIAMLEREIVIPRKDSASTRKGVKDFIESLNKAMDEISNIPLKMLNSGSHYDKTSIEYDDEFDFMVCPSGKYEAVFTNCPPGFCKLRKGRTTINDLDQAFNKNGYLVPELFKQKMFSIFEDCITSPGFRQGRRIKRMPRKPESPAFTLQFDLGSGIPTVDIDLVPAVRIDSWPSTGRKIQYSSRVSSGFHRPRWTYVPRFSVEL